ncbi:MAG: hypothetical protein JOZ55_05210 [Alphaproteobacteria bacterium]|nr:hypothetical protein [Alphaproteobacteria bacterium]
MKRLLLVTLAAILLSACGIKSDLVTPEGKATPADQQDPSKPPHPLGQ